MAETLCTIKLPSGSVAVKDVPVYYQGEYFAVEMSPALAEQLWEGQAQAYTLEFHNDDMKNMNVLCTHWIKTSDSEAKCFFTRHEILV